LVSQFKKSFELSQQQIAIAGYLDELEHDLDGGVSLLSRGYAAKMPTLHLQDDKLRPRLQARIARHSQLARQHTSANTFVDLLRTLQAVQSSLANVSQLLEQGRLQDAVPAVQYATRLLDGAEDWKKQSDTYKLLKVRKTTEIPRTVS
jgi:hypothetical protein